MADANHVAFLRCVACSQFKDRLISLCNFCPAFVEGTILAFERPRSSLDLSECYYASVGGATPAYGSLFVSVCVCPELNLGNR